ncbi:MAG: cell division protein ZapA [Myxococcales bacterium]|jgi:cell division protein ZapA|nr:cell division protein ZapA [Myxococcales bacterium]
MSRPAIQLKVAGQTYRVITSATQEDLQRLAETVEDRMLASTPPGRQPTQQALVLAAITLAHELEEERARRRRAEERHREMLQNLLGRIDAVLDEAEVPVEAAARAPRSVDEELELPDGP